VWRGHSCPWPACSLREPVPTTVFTAKGLQPWQALSLEWQICFWIDFAGKSARATHACHTTVRHRIKHLHEDSITSTKAQRLAPRLNDFHLESTTCTKTQRLSSEIIKNAIRGDFSPWKFVDDPEVGLSRKSRSTGSPMALASILRSIRHETEPGWRTRPLRTSSIARR
jgi:hypothetical protein